MQRIMIALAAAVALFVAGAAAYLGLREEASPPGANAVGVAGADIGGPFTLTTHEGREITADQLIDGPTLVYFGYTFCPDVCPVDVQEMTDASDMLAERGIEVTPVFITVDPARDTPEALKWFAEAMHPRMIALTGSPEQTQAAAEAYKVYYSKVEMPDSAAGYLMNHTNFTYLMTPEGIRALLRGEATAEDIANEVERVLG